MRFFCFVRYAKISIDMLESKDKKLDYYAKLDVDKVLAELGSTSNGLSEAGVIASRNLFGHNTIEQKKELNIVLEFLSYFKSPLIIILLVVTAISAYLGEIKNAVIVGVMILLSVVLDFLEEHNASQAAKRLQEKVRTSTTVLRDGKKKEIKANQVCVGDIILLSAGNLIPADARLIDSNDFYVNQSALTGESFPNAKSKKRLNGQKISLPDLHNIVFAGTSVVSGSASAVVLKIGNQTEFGQIAGRLMKKEDKSEFEIGVTKFGYFTMKIIIFLVLFIFLFNSLVNHRILESFMFAIAVAVGVTPELLPMIMSITMARGSTRMSKKGVIVKRLAAIPNFGSMDILCTDKTGTLTQDKIIVVNYTNVTGEHDERVLKYTYLNGYFQSGVKNPLDDAIVDFKKISTTGYKKVDEIPFDFIRRLMSVVIDSKDGRHMITKGAPEEIFKKCISFRQGNKTVRFGKIWQKKAHEHYQALSAEGYRVLAVATKRLSDKKRNYTKQDENDLELCGFVSFLDPPRQGLKDVLQKLNQVGVSVKVITGDNELVAQKICREVGLPVSSVVLGSQMSQLSNEALSVLVEKANVFARFSPEEKDRVISALRNNGHVVGYLGDGINDAPSLKTADVGISVNNAVDVAKESADIVLTQKNLEILTEGLLEGRKSFGNTMKYIMMGLSSNFGNMFSMTMVVFFVPFLPMLPIQILLNNFIYDLSQVTIPTDNVDRDWLQKPRRWNMHFIKRFMLVFGPISSIFDFTTFFVLYGVFHASQAVFQAGWFMESLATQTLVIHFIRTKKLPFIQSRPSKYLLLSTLICVFLGWLIPFSPLAHYFKFGQPSMAIVGSLILIILVYFVFVEVAKRIFYKNCDFDISAHSGKSMRIVAK